MTYQTLLTSLENGIFIITINRPDKLNAINNQVMTEINNAVQEVYDNDAIRSAIITVSIVWDKDEPWGNTNSIA